MACIIRSPVKHAMLATADKPHKHNPLNLTEELQNLEFPSPYQYTRAMINHGFFRVGTATPECTVADCSANTRA